MPTDQDRADYRRIGQQIARQLRSKPLETWSSNRLQALLADLLGRHHDLKLPLLDLMQRPGFLSLAARTETAHESVTRASLLQQLQDTFAPRMVNALADVLDGFLNLPPPPPQGGDRDQSHRAPEPWPAAPTRGRADEPAARGRPAPPDLQQLSELKEDLNQQRRRLDHLVATTEQQAHPAPAPVWPPSGVQPGQPGDTAGGNTPDRQVTLLWFVVGLLVSLLVVLIAGNRNAWQSGPSGSSGSSQSPAQPPKTPDQPMPRTGLWQACEQQAVQEAPPPQSGETWWPVVGPANALDDAQRHCRTDAFVSGSGQVQIASFRDREVARQFAEQLTNDRSHPWSFEVGAPKIPVP